MATAVQLSMAEYLSTTYEPDREFVDGELMERNLGTWDHGRVQALLTIMLAAFETEAKAYVATEWRARVSATRVRIPDVTLVEAGPQDQVLAAPPLLTVEVLSPEDTWAATKRKCEDYARMGVRTMWIVDPSRHRAQVWRDGEWRETDVLEVAETPIRIELQELFGRMNPVGRG